MAEVKKIKISELLDFVNSKEYLQFKNKPISKLRALSYINNPRAEKDDVVLFMAFEKNELVGYRTIFADKIFINNTEYKFGWLSGNWVLPKKRRTGISKLLLNEVLKDWNEQLMFTNYAEASRNLYLRSGKFNEAVSKSGLRMYLNLNLAHILPPKSNLFKTLKPCLICFDFCFNIFNNLRLQILNKSINKPKLDYIETESINSEISKYLSNNHHKIFFKRNTEEYNWIEKYPWITEQKQEINYNFSQYAKDINRTYISIKLNNKLVGFLILFKRNSILTIPYFHLNNEHIYDAVLYLKQYMIKNNIAYFTTYIPQLVTEFNKPQKIFLKKKQQKTNYYACNSLFNNISDLKNIELQDGDGDMSFA